MLRILDFRFAALSAIILFAVLISSSTFAANHQLKRRVTPKPVYEVLPEYADCTTIVLKLREGTKRPALGNNQFLADGKSWSAINDILSTSDGAVELRPGFSLKPARLDQMRAEGSQRTGVQLPDLSLYYRIQLDEDLPSPARLDMVNRLNSLDLVEIAYFQTKSQLCSGPPEGKGPKDPEVPETPSFEYGQYYLGPTPVGFDAYYAWSFPGGHGEDVKVFDIEGSWNDDHEDLHGGTDDFHIAGEIDTSMWTSFYHGTAVLGIIAADSNDFGMTGIAHEADLGTISVDFMPTSDAIIIASANAEPGDVILLEVASLHAPTGEWIAAECDQACFDAMLTASALGQIVVEAAGNSNQDLDDIELFDSLFYPDYRFSGAIVVAMSSAFHVPDQRTCYGQRIDVHGFGSHDIYTLGRGSLWGTEENNAYTQGFSGTSAASAEMAAVCAVVQGVYKQQDGSTLDHAGMRALLTTNGVPQADHYKTIGPLPDLAIVCDAITGNIRPAPPVLVSPDDAAEFDAPAQPVFDWDDVPGALSYEIMMDDNFNFISPEVHEEGLTNSQLTSPVLQQGKYFWRTRAVNADGFGSWSDVRTILVDIEIQAPILLWPDDGGKTFVIMNIPFEWYQIDGIADYVIEIDSLADFSTPHISTYSLTCTDGTCLYGVSYLDQRPYYWRVRVLGNNTPWSEEWTFMVNGPTGLKDAPAPAEPVAESGSVKLGANYPNPFNPVTQITFSLPAGSHARLEIFNILGQKVETLVDEYLSAGQHTAVWNAGTKPSGVYLYRLTTENEVVSRKMLLIK